MVRSLYLAGEIIALQQRRSGSSENRYRIFGKSGVRDLHRPPNSDGSVFIRMHLIEETKRYPNCNSEGKPKLVELKISLLLKDQLGGHLGLESCSNEKIDWLEVTPEDEEESACWGHSVSLHKTKLAYPRRPARRTTQMKNFLRYREQIRNQLVKDKPAGQADQELIQEEGTL
ncbi:hypothetical protein F511_25257 [Dorcoceras hygrometricum]|uniref:Uncharacterized protein n=1 Tax=Dorcoceras hygrometricum TaxID=472368 RepID=A0A2Z7B9B7_9LAMI|nr:hypothetical protein F511_25257 [Dorcoceras hygrometricum]